MRVLVALLGLSPGTVTGVFYALQEQGYGVVDRVLTLTTNGPQADACERLIADELVRWQTATGRKVSYKPERIQARDLDDAASTEEFQTRVGEILRNQKAIRGNEVFLSVAGGRKSMAALAAVAAQAYGPDLILHLYVSDELERQGDISSLQANPRLIERCLHPGPDEYTLVEIPFFAVENVAPGQLQLVLRGEANKFAVEYVHEHPEVLRDHPHTKDRERLLSYLFEVKVAEYLKDATAAGVSWDQTRPGYVIPGHKRAGDIDVYAERARGYQREVLVCECKLFLPATEDPILPSKKVAQLLKKAPAVQAAEGAYGDDPTLELWVVTNATQADEDAVRIARENNVRLMHARLPRDWERRVDWQIQAIEPFG